MSKNSEKPQKLMWSALKGNLGFLRSVWITFDTFCLWCVFQNLLVEEADVKGLEELCDVLALPEVKMIRRADDTMKRANEGVPEESGRGKRKRKSQNYAAMAKGESTDVVPLVVTSPQKRARGAVKIELLPEEEPDFARY